MNFLQSCELARTKAGREKLSFYLFIAGGIAGVMQLTTPVEFSPGTEMFAEARNLAEHGSFANPFDIARTGFTAVNPPLYPFILAVLIRLLTVPHLVAAAATAGNILANAATAACLPRISVVFYRDAIPGALAAALWLATARLMPVWDTNYAVAGIIFFCLFSAWSIERAHRFVFFGVLAGLAAGLLVLLNPASLMITLPWIVFILFGYFPIKYLKRRNTSFRHAASYCGVLLAVLLVVVSAWVLRNRHQLGALMLRTNLGMTLYASNNDCAESSLLASLRSGCFQTHHPNMSVPEVRLYLTLGEVEYDRRRTADAIRWAQTHPAHFRQLTMKRAWEFWFPPAEPNAFEAYMIWLATALSVPGLLLMIKKRIPATIFVLAVLLVYPLMYYVVVTDVRYRYPTLWLSLLPAGYFLTGMMRARCSERAQLLRGTSFACSAELVWGYLWRARSKR